MKAATFLLRIAFILGSTVPMNASSASKTVSLHCHDGGSSEAQLLSGGVYRILAYVRESRHAKTPLQCEYLLRQTISATVMLEMRHAGRPARRAVEEVAVPSFTVTLTRSRAVMLKFQWNSNSIKFIETQVGDVLKIGLKTDNVSAKQIDNELYLQMFIVNEDSCIDGAQGFHYKSTCHLLLPVNLICGGNHLRNCSVMDMFGLQFKSQSDLIEFAHLEFLERLGKPALLGSRFCNGTLMYWHETGDGECQGKLCDGDFGNLIESSTTTSDVGQLVTLQVTPDGKPAIGRVNPDEADTQLLKALLAIPAPADGDGGCSPRDADGCAFSCAATPANLTRAGGDWRSDGRADAKTPVTAVEVCIIFLAVAVICLALWFLWYLPWSQNSQNGNSLYGNGTNGLPEPTDETIHTAAEYN